MPIVPLDLQVNIAQMVNVAAQEQATQGQPIIQQEYMGLQTKEQAKIDQEKVAIIKKAEGKKIEGDKRGGGGGYYHRERRKEPRKEEEEGREKYTFDPIRGHLIDVIR